MLPRFPRVPHGQLIGAGASLRIVAALGLAGSILAGCGFVPRTAPSVVVLLTRSHRSTRRHLGERRHRRGETRRSCRQLGSDSRLGRHRS